MLREYGVCLTQVQLTAYAEKLGSILLPKLKFTQTRRLEVVARTSASTVQRFAQLNGDTRGQCEKPSEETER